MSERLVKQGNILKIILTYQILITIFRSYLQSFNYIHTLSFFLFSYFILLLFLDVLICSPPVSDFK